MPMQSMVLQSIRWIVYTTVPAKGNIDISHTKTLAEQFFNGQLSLHVAYADYHFFADAVTLNNIHDVNLPFNVPVRCFFCQR
ncbi:hypothetical protein BLOT_009975 [Blomia tropicalis]|nr:hypothetical protein BLOT_009975 [Blomia tropicalis]